MKIGIFSGSFNPVHIGHLIIANHIAEYSDLDEVWLMLTPQNPLKLDLTLLDENVRYDMLQLAVDDYEKLRVSDFELSLPKPSYTYNTLRLLKERYPEHEFSLIIGADNWASFDKWKNKEEIIHEFSIYIYPRLGYDVEIPKELSQVKLIDSPIIDISSTYIRGNIKNKRNVKPLLVSEVYSYIKNHELYLK